MKKLAPKAIIEPSMYAKDGLFAFNVGYYLLWFEFLALSPSYELARRYNTGEWTQEDEQNRPPDFEKVLGVYANLGDVQRELFRNWWLDRGFDSFGYHGKRPKVDKVAYLARFKDREPYFRDAADKFVDGPWTEQGRQRTMIVAIPIGLPRSKIAKQIDALLAGYPEKKRSLRNSPPKYALQARKLHRHTYFRYLYVLWQRCVRPHDPLWKIGVRSKVSGTYSHRLDADADTGRHDLVEDKYALKILTHRAIERGKMMAENAARGIFPSYQKCLHALPFDFEVLNDMRFSRRTWQVAERKRESRAASAEI